MSWRRFLFVHELLRTFDEDTAVAALRTNATRLVEHLVEFLSEWIVTFLEPAREVTKVRDSELLFLHEKDHWFRAIWQDLHLAATLDRVKSRDRPLVGLVRCICKDARSKGEEDTGSWTFFSCVCLMASMARSVNCHGQKNAVQVHLIGAEPIVQVKR